MSKKNYRVIGILVAALMFVMALSGLASAETTTPTGTFYINEIRIDQTGSDVDEYFEIYGPSNASLDGLTYIVIGDDSSGGNSGTVEVVVSLDGESTNATGYFLAAEDGDTFGATADLITTFSFENSDNVTHLLVRDFTAALNDDLDTAPQGTLDLPHPWSAIEDAVSLVENDDPGSQFYYAEDLGFFDLGPNGSFVPAHAYRQSDGNSRTPTGIWLIGDFVPSGEDTPGATNNGVTAVSLNTLESNSDQSVSLLVPILIMVAIMTGLIIKKRIVR